MRKNSLLNLCVHTSIPWHFIELFVAITVAFAAIGCTDRTRGNAIKIPVPAVSANDPAIIPVDSSDAWWVERHIAKTNERIQTPKIIFIGDSITHFWEKNVFQYTNGQVAWNELKNKYNSELMNLGFSGDKTQHVLWRLENGEFSVGINPEYIVLMIGTNNKDKPESIAAGIGNIIKILHENAPSAKIILMSLLPRGTGANDKNTIRNNAVNEIIKKYNGHAMVKYLDIGKYYMNHDGTLKDELFSDRLHLTLAGYDLWKRKLLDIID
ncbi:MAG: GDSL-type esterase/lipase family protein [Zoogloeaceae bacterium]|jgi:lysophospholipase L1-like esterase|nr:GDSL-type esterase/lipase family protein [Zoogloeaceae bacterium]